MTWRPLTVVLPRPAPAPAAGWIHGLRWTEGSGLFAEVELTARALQAIASGEYRYFSPVFLYDPVDGDVLHIGTETVQVLHCPGHTPGHVVFYNAAMHFAWVGDVLFAGSIGRTDFPGGNHADLIHAIKSKLLPLGDDVQFISGHGPMSNFGQERQFNPHLLA